MEQIRIASYISIALHFIRKVIRHVRVPFAKSPKRYFDYNPTESNYASKVVIFFRSSKGNSLESFIIHTETSEDAHKLAKYLFKSMCTYCKPFISIFNDNIDILGQMVALHPCLLKVIKQKAPIYMPNESRILFQQVKNYAPGNLSDKIAITLEEICRI